MTIDFVSWNEALGSWFLEEGPGRPVYLSATAPELQRMNDRMGLGLLDPVTELSELVSLHRYSTFGRKHQHWWAAKSHDLPPWLPFLAAAVAVVDQQVEKGSSAFYAPLSRFMGLSQQITQADYDETIGRWWWALSQWLRSIESGQRGFPTWDSIPEEGPRCVIGHPYTQVLLRRQERSHIDSFLAEFEGLEEEPPVAADRRAVALHLVAALRRWARGRNSVGGRLRAILEREQGDEVFSLGYMLLDRLFDRSTGEQVSDGAARSITIVPVLDEYERRIRLAAMTPKWVTATEPVAVKHAVSELTEPGEPVFLDLALTDELLRTGAEVGEDPVALLAGRDCHTLATRDFDYWCGVSGLSADERCYLLMPASVAARVGLRETMPVDGMPDGWLVTGPMTSAEVPPDLTDHVVASQRRLVPRLRGGLKLERRVYLHGGEPVLELPGVTGPVNLDGAAVPTNSGELDLTTLDLSPGAHVIEAGGFRLELTIVDDLQLPVASPTLGRGPTGLVVQVEPETSVVTGARRFPDDPDQPRRRLIPVAREFWKLGAPGEIAAIKPTRAEWASRAGLPHVAVEPDALSTHPAGRQVKFPTWIAWEDPDEGWTLAWWGQGSSGNDDDAPIDWQVWRRLTEMIGIEPHFHQFAWKDYSAELAPIWRAYCAVATRA